MSDAAEDAGRENDRRANVEIRQIFVDAYDTLEPFFDPKNRWGGLSHEHLAYRALHERFPQLTGEQVLIIVTAAKRVFSSGNRPAE